MFGKIMGFVGLAWSPIYVELALFDAILYPSRTSMDLDRRCLSRLLAKPPVVELSTWVGVASWVYDPFRQV